MSLPFTPSSEILCKSYLENEAIRTRNLYVINKRKSPYGKNGLSVNALEICEWAVTANGFDFAVEKEIPFKRKSLCSALKEGDTIIGLTDYENKIVYIKEKLLSMNHAAIHELTHALQHSKFYIPNNYVSKPYEINRTEREANYFARAVLLPKDKFKKRYLKLSHDFQTLNEIFIQLSEDFQVPGGTAKVRAKNLGLIDEDTLQKLLKEKTI